MEDDILATALDKLPPPPPMVQSRRPEPPNGNLGPAVPSSRDIKKDQNNPPSYADLLNQIDYTQPHPFTQQEQYIEDEPAAAAAAVEAPSPPSPPMKRTKKVKTEELTFRPSSSSAPPPETLWWKHRRALLVGVIVLAMLLYGIPKLQTLSPMFSTQIVIYKLSHLGMAAVAGGSASIYAAATTYFM